jgi:hypothetical protein
MKKIAGKGQQFQMEVEGVQLVRIPSGDYEFASFTYRFDNPNPNGLNFIKAGDGRALMPDGSWSRTTIDAKDWGIEYVSAILDDERPFMAVTPIKSLKDLEVALSQNPGYTHVLDFPSVEMVDGVAVPSLRIRNSVALFIQKHASEFIDDFLNNKLFLAAREEPGKLADNLVGFERTKISSGVPVIHGIEDNKEVQDSFVDWLKNLDT